MKGPLRRWLLLRRGGPDPPVCVVCGALVREHQPDGPCPVCEICGMTRDGHDDRGRCVWPGR
jgi:hypothetical protein